MATKSDQPNEPLRWRSATVSELQAEGILLVEDGNHGEYRPRSEEFVDHGTAFIRAADIDAGNVLFGSASKINDVALKRITKGIGAGGDILLTHKGTVGKVAFAYEHAPQFVCSPQTTFWRTLNQSILARRYLYAFLRSPGFHRQLSARAGETDMAPYVSLTAQRTLTVLLPPAREQVAIATVLGALDDKIDINRRMNETLHEMARALFRSWFIAFDPVHAKAAGKKPFGMIDTTAALFTDGFEKSSSGQIPKNWRLSTIGQATSLIVDHRGKTPTKLGGGWSTFGVRAISAKNVKGGRLIQLDSARLVAEDLYRRWMPEELHTGDVLLTSEAPLGEMFYLATAQKYCLSQRLFALRAASTECAPAYLYLWLNSDQARADLHSRATGTTVLGIRQSELRKIAIVLPPPTLSAAFHDTVHPWFERLQRNEDHAALLTELRDTLLPRLLSGELRIKDAEKLVGEAT